MRVRVEAILKSKEDIMRRIVALALMLTAVAGAFATGSQEDAGPAALGTEENPIVWSFVPSGEMEQVATGAAEMAQLLFEATGYYFETNVATEYAGVVEALSTDPPSAHMASLNTFGYIVAADRGVADAALVSVRFGNPFYNGQIIARTDSGINTVEDLAGATFARPDPLSTSGWIIPMITMRAAGIDTENNLDVVDAGGHPAVVAAVYSGDVNAGASYVDARTTIEDDNPDVMDVVKVIAISPDIPNDGVQFSPVVPADMRETIVQALLDIASTEAGVAVLRKAYSWTELTRRGDDFYDPFRQVLQASGIDPVTLME